jgi:signal peptidase I
MEKIQPAKRPSQTTFKKILNEYVKHVVFVVLILCTFRSSIADWNDVPTGSMNPSILEGDRIFVNKLAYDLKVPFTTWHIAEWGAPKRGDVVVFYSPDGTRMVKRVIGLPGDTIELEDHQLNINGQPCSYGPADPKYPAAMAGRPLVGPIATEKLDQRLHPVMQLPQTRNPGNFGPFVVPAGRYFMMGDNRDNSADSRYWGVVERSQIVGRAAGIAMSLDPDDSYWPRWQRFFTSIP